MTHLLMTTWDGSGTTPPLMSIARALVERGYSLRVLADPVLKPDVEATGAEHVSWTRAPHRTERSLSRHFIEDWAGLEPTEGFARMRDRLAVGPAAAFAADVREELACRPAAAVLSELLLFGPQVAAEAAQVPCIVLNPTINVVPAPGVPPFGAGLMPATNEAERQRDDELAAIMMAAWDEALPALNAARAEQGLEPLQHVLDQGRSVARILVLTSRAFDFIGPLPPTVKHVGPRLDDPVWAGEWTPPPGDRPARPRRAQRGFPEPGGPAAAHRSRGRRTPHPRRAHDRTRDRPGLHPGPGERPGRPRGPAQPGPARGGAGDHTLRPRRHDQGPSGRRSARVPADGARPARRRRARSPRRRRTAARTVSSARRDRERHPPRPRRQLLPPRRPNASQRRSQRRQPPTWPWPRSRRSWPPPPCEKRSRPPETGPSAFTTSKGRVRLITLDTHSRRSSPPGGSRRQ